MTTHAPKNASATTPLANCFRSERDTHAQEHTKIRSMRESGGEKRNVDFSCLCANDELIAERDSNITLDAVQCTLHIDRRRCHSTTCMQDTTKSSLLFQFALFVLPGAACPSIRRILQHTPLFFCSFCSFFFFFKHKRKLIPLYFCF